MIETHTIYLFQSRIHEGQQVILTLKDKGVLDEEDDTLVNVNVMDDERYDKVKIRAFTVVLYFTNTNLLYCFCVEC